MKLFKPVGLDELRLTYDANMRTYPLHVDHQQVFYPAPNLDYAVRIARDWNAKTQPFAGYVTECEVADDFGRNFPPRRAVKKLEKESWIPSELLSEFNGHIEGPIKVAEGHFGPGFRGYVPDHFNFANRDALSQFVMLSILLDFSRMDFVGEIHANSLTVFLHFQYWRTCNLEMTEISDEQRERILASIEKTWSKELPPLPLLPGDNP